jgi:hypothetical protein
VDRRGDSRIGQIRLTVRLTIDDLIGPLLFGPYGIGGLAERHADVYPGRNDVLMRTLFPPVSADLLTFYLP